MSTGELEGSLREWIYMGNFRALLRKPWLSILAQFPKKKANIVRLFMHILHPIDSQHNLSHVFGNWQNCCLHTFRSRHELPCCRSLRTQDPLRCVSYALSLRLSFISHLPPRLFSVWLKALSISIIFHVFTRFNPQ